MINDWLLHDGQYAASTQAFESSGQVGPLMILASVSLGSAVSCHRTGSFVYCPQKLRKPTLQAYIPSRSSK